LVVVFFFFWIKVQHWHLFALGFSALLLRSNKKGERARKGAKKKGGLRWLIFSFFGKKNTFQTRLLIAGGLPVFF